MLLRLCPPILAIAALALLSGCANPPPAPVAAAPVHGTYKVGTPYRIDGVWYYPHEDLTYDQTGIASWYGRSFHGKYTANGEVFDLNALTAAHRTLPMPSIVEVTNLDNGRSIRLRVNDRGPFVRNRIIDVSRRAAQLLGFEAQGTAKVRVKILVPESIQAASLARRNSGETLAAATLPALPPVPVSVETLGPTDGMRVASAAPPPQAAAVPPVPAPVVAPPPLPDKVVIVPVRATQIYIQAGAFARPANALRVKGRLAALGTVKVFAVRINGIDLYRVRLGPIPNVDAADKLLDRVFAAGLEGARIVVD